MLFTSCSSADLEFNVASSSIPAKRYSEGEVLLMGNMTTFEEHFLDYMSQEKLNLIRSYSKEWSASYRYAN